jgi:hypothetical protein
MIPPPESKSLTPGSMIKDSSSHPARLAQSSSRTTKANEVSALAEGLEGAGEKWRVASCFGKKGEKLTTMRKEENEMPKPILVTGMAGVATFAVPLSILLHIAALKRMKLGTGARRRQHFH